MSEWISVKDRLPKKDGRYLTWHKWYNNDMYDVRYFAKCLEDVDDYDFYNRKHSGFYDYSSEYGHYEIDDITYWMPLPKPPEE